MVFQCCANIGYELWRVYCHVTVSYLESQILFALLYHIYLHFQHWWCIPDAIYINTSLRNQDTHILRVWRKNQELIMFYVQQWVDGYQGTGREPDESVAFACGVDLGLPVPFKRCPQISVILFQFSFMLLALPASSRTRSPFYSIIMVLMLGTALETIIF